MAHYGADLAISTLSSQLSAGATTINVTDVSRFPSGGSFVVAVGDSAATAELIECSSKDNGLNTITVATRGFSSTTDSTHANGTQIMCVYCAEDHNEFRALVNPYYCRLWHSSNEAIADDTLSGIALDTTTINGTDNDLFELAVSRTIGIGGIDYSVNGIRVPEAGLYQVSACVRFASSATGYRTLSIAEYVLADDSYVGAIAEQTIPAAGTAQFLSVNAVCPLENTSYIVARVRQNSSGPLDLLSVGYYAPVLSLLKVGEL